MRFKRYILFSFLLILQAAPSFGQKKFGVDSLRINEKLMYKTKNVTPLLANGLDASGLIDMAAFSQTALDSLEKIGIDLINIMHFGAHPDSSSENNSTAIEAACTYARAKGSGILLIPERTFTLERRIIVDWNNGGVVGLGPGSILTRSGTFNSGYLRPGMEATSANPQGVFVLGWLSDNLLFKDFTVDLAYSVTAGDGGTGNGIGPDSCSNVLIENCKVLNATGHTYSIWVKRVKHATIINCETSGDYDRVYAPAGEYNDQNGIQVSTGSFDIKVFNNYAHDHDGFGILFYTGGVNGNGQGSIQGNTIYHVTQTAVQVKNATSGGDRIYNDFMVVKNFIRNALYYGVQFTSNDKQIERIHINENTIDSTLQAVNLYKTRFASISKNTVLNTFETTLGTGVFEVNNSLGTIYEGNKILYSASSGLGLRSTDSLAVVRANFIFEPAHAGILANTSYWPRIEGNDIINCNTSVQADGFYSAAISCNVFGNHFIINNRMLDLRGTPLQEWGLISSAAAADSNNYIFGNFANKTTKTGTAYDNQVNGKNVYRGEVTVAASATQTRIYTKRFSYYDKLLFQHYGSLTNLRFGYGDKDGFVLYHDDSGAGGQIITYTVTQ